MRSFLTGLGIAIGVAAVILLTSIGEGLHQYLLDEFSQFGTNVITIQPGKSQTHGANAGIFGTIKPSDPGRCRCLAPRSLYLSL